MRPRKKKVQITEEFLSGLLNECLEDSNNLKAEITNLYNTWNLKAIEVGEIAVIGKDIVKLLDQRDKNIDKKLRITQQIATLLIDKKKTEMLTKNDEEEEEGGGDLSDEMRRLVEEAVQKKTR